MANHERTDPARDAPREVADERQRPGSARPPEAEPPPRPSNAVPEPDQEEAPELLGERSDYPIPFGGPPDR